MEETDMFSGLGADGMQDPNFITVDNYGSSQRTFSTLYLTFYYIYVPFISLYSST